MFFDNVENLNMSGQETLEKAVLEVGNKLGIAGVKTDGVKVAAAGEESRFCQIPSDKSEGLLVSII